MKTTTMKFTFEERRFLRDALEAAAEHYADQAAEMQTNGIHASHIETINSTEDRARDFAARFDPESE